MNQVESPMKPLNRADLERKSEDMVVANIEHLEELFP